MLLTIITPTFKRPDLLQKNLELIDKLYSKFKNFEWLLVIEKKDLETIKFIKKYSRKYLRYKIGSFGSVEKAFAAGLSNSKGKYINFHGDDDFFVKKNLKLINKKLFINDYHWLIFHGTYINSNFKEIRKTISKIKFFLLKNNNIFDISLISYIMSPSIFVKRSIAIKCGGWGIRKQSASDYRLWLKINYKYKPKIILKNLTNIMLTESTVTGRFEFNRYIFQIKQALKLSRMNYFGKIFIVLFMSIVIVYNFFTKTNFLKKLIVLK